MFVAVLASLPPRETGRREMIEDASPPDYLRADGYLKTLIGARALASALELGLVDVLVEGDQDLATISRLTGLGQRSASILVQLLVGAGVVRRHDALVGLDARFREVLAYRDLIETKLELCALLLPDLADGFTRLLADRDGFMASSRVFDLFRYDLCLDPTPENLQHTRRWMRLTTVLTRYEAAPFLDLLPCDRFLRALDIGGNSGELARHLCQRNPQLRVTVFDLPVVCYIGAEFLSEAPERERIEFLPGDALRDPLPRGVDLVCFKSILHDWPEASAREFLARAATALAPGGILAIFERGPLELERLPGYADIPILLFAGFYRSPVYYARVLEHLGLESIDLVRVDLDAPFHLVTARKPG